MRGAKLSHPSGEFYLTGGRLTAAKNFDLIIKSFNKLGLPLKIYGSGPQETSLKSIAKGNIKFLGGVDDNRMAELYSGAKAFILAQKDEDFGMTAVEAMSFGTPVIAYKGGGYLESVISGKTGIFFDELNVESLSKTVKNFNDFTSKMVTDHRSITAENCITQAKKFSKERFVSEIKRFVEGKLV